MSLGTKTILVVDDEKDTREMIGRWLRRSGYDVALAQDGWDALLVMDEHRIDLILLDIMMPNLDGGTFLKILRGTATKQETPVVIVTALEKSEAAKVMGTEARIAGMVTKTQASLQDLGEKLRNVFGEPAGDKLPPS
jgi:two-component system OmpR family response regulator